MLVNKYLTTKQAGSWARKADTKGQTLCDSAYLKSSESWDSQSQKLAQWVQRLGRQMQLVFNGDGVWVWEDENVLETDGGGDYTTSWMYLSHWIAHLQTNDKSGKFYVVCILS